MAIDIITRSDLDEFRTELLEDLKEVIKSINNTGLREVLKSSEVMERLKISPGTLQNLRVNGTIPYVKIGGLIFYEAEEIQKVMEANRIHPTNDL